MYEQGNRNDELANNGGSFSVISTVTRLQFVILSRLGSIGSKGIQYKWYMSPSELTTSIPRVPVINSRKLKP
jgi:hypothetical protein